MLEEWIQNIVVFLIFMTLIRQIIPEEKYQKYVRLILGLIMIMVILAPLTQLLGTEETVYRNFIQDQMAISAIDAGVSGKMFASEEKYNESYRQIVQEEIEAYFDASSMSVKYCHIDLNDNMESDTYGEIYEISVGILPLDRQMFEESAEPSIYVEPIEIGSKSESQEKNVYIPEEKMKEWKQDLSLQFGVDEEQLKLEIVS